MKSREEIMKNRAIAATAFLWLGSIMLFLGVLLLAGAMWTFLSFGAFFMVSGMMLVWSIDDWKEGQNEKD